MALDTYLHVFSHDLQDVFSIDFQFKIDVLEWSRHPSFLLLGLNNGQAQLVHIPSKMPLPPVQVCDEGFNGLQNFCFLSRGSSKLITLKVQDLQVLDNALQNKDYAALKDFQSQIQIETLELSAPCCTLTRDFASFESALSILEDNQMKHTLNLDTDVVKVLVPQHSNNLVLFVLDSEGAIHVVCAVTMMTLFRFSSLHVSDMVLIEDTDTCPQVMMVAYDGQDHFLQIRKYPDFEQCLYSLKVSPYCRLLDTCIDQENPMFIEGTFENDEFNDENVDTLNQNDDDENAGNKNCVKMLRIRAICEGNSDARLLRLLKRKKFEEATKFATLNKLDLEEVYRAKCIALMSDLSAWTTGKDIEAEETLLEDLEQSLKMIQTDLTFVVKFCLNATFKDLEKIRRLLKLARQCIQTMGMGQLDMKLMVDVSRALQRLDTFIFIHATDDRNVEDWLEFLHANIYSQLLGTLKQGNVQAALILWTRHQYDVEWNQEMIKSVLEMVPSTETESLDFLSKFMSDCVLKMRNQAAMTSTIEVFSSWIIKSAKALESKKSNWPQSGLAFAQFLVDSLFHVVDKDDKGLSSARIPLLLQEQKNRPGTSLCKLITLLDTLKDLIKLHTDFKIKVSIIPEFLLENSRNDRTHQLHDFLNREKKSANDA